MKKILIAIIVISIFFAMTSCFYIYNNKLKNQLSTEKNENDNLHKKYRLYELQQKRIEYMTKTLMITYNLSKWEAHYYCVIFNDFSENYNIPWEIYPAIIRIESNFKVSLISSKSAKGLMQILEPTGRSIAKELNIEYEDSETLWNDVMNLILGCQYLSAGINKLGLENGVKSYLGGPLYFKSVKTNKEAGQYIEEYRTTVWKEYLNLQYIFRGIVDESNDNYKEIHISKYPDSISTINVKIFPIK